MVEIPGELPRDITIEDFKNCFLQIGIRFKAWEKGPKTINILHKEIQTGESIIRITEILRRGRRILRAERFVRNVAVNLWTADYRNVSKLLMLHETSRRIKGKSKPRHTNHSVVGKISADDKLLSAAAQRCIETKTIVKGTFCSVDLKPKQSPLDGATRFFKKRSIPPDACLLIDGQMYEHESSRTESYPGLPTFREIDVFHCFVREEMCTAVDARRFGNKQVVLEWRPPEDYLVEEIQKPFEPLITLASSI